MADKLPAKVSDREGKTIDLQDWFSEGPLKNLNPEQRRALQQRLEGAHLVSVSASQSYSGPLPPPEILAKFNEVIPGGAERIVAMAEKQSAHRIAIESKVIDRQQSRSNRGQHYALIVTLVALVGAFWAIMTGHDSAGGTIGTTAIGSVAIAFITGQYQQNANLREKKPN